MFAATASHPLSPSFQPIHATSLPKFGFLKSRAHSHSATWRIVSKATRSSSSIVTKSSSRRLTRKLTFSPAPCLQQWCLQAAFALFCVMFVSLICFCGSVCVCVRQSFMPVADVLQVRRYVAAGRSIKYFVADEVLHLIDAEGLFRDGDAQSSSY